MMMMMRMVCLFCKDAGCGLRGAIIGGCVDDHLSMVVWNVHS